MVDDAPNLYRKGSVLSEKYYQTAQKSYHHYDIVEDVAVFK